MRAVPVEGNERRQYGARAAAILPTVLKKRYKNAHHVRPAQPENVSTVTVRVKRREISIVGESESTAPVSGAACPSIPHRSEAAVAQFVLYRGCRLWR